MNVPSSRRPDPPDVLYVVPTWTWNEQTVRGLTLAPQGRRAASTFLRTRTGGGLRVYMNRPWYSSGVDELLGVVLEDQPWITWPIDVEAGIQVSAVAKALAEEFATRVFDDVFAKPAGKASAPATERLLAGIACATRASVRAPRTRAKMTAAEAALVSHDAALRVARLETTADLARLSDLVAKYFLPSGDPQKYVTHWGRDPIWGADDVLAGPFIHQFPLRVAVGSNISLLEAPGHDVTVVGHQPQYDDVRKLWYCDLQLNAGTSYFPFVKLALARYQPYSISGQHLSKVVFPDFTQLVAERTAGMTKVGRSGVAISLRGPGGFTKNAVDLSPDQETRLNLSRFAVAQVERLPAAATTDLAWSAVGDEVRLELSDAGGLDDVRFHGTVPVPARAEGEQLRVVLREYEIFETDATERDDFLVRPISAGDFDFLVKPVKYRLVYADHLSL